MDDWDLGIEDIRLLDVYFSLIGLGMGFSGFIIGY